MCPRCELVLFSRATNIRQAIKTNTIPTPVFSEVGAVTICPVVDPSPNPSFALQPTSSNSQFLMGRYRVSGENRSAFVIDRLNESCIANSSLTCSELSVRSNAPVGRGILIVTYTASSGQNTVRVNYGETGIYLEQPGQTLRRLTNGTLDGSLLVYGSLTGLLVLCIEEKEERAPFAQFITPIGPDASCSQSTSGQGQPVRFDILVNPGIGQHTVYVAAEENCSSSMRSESFTVSCESLYLS